MRPLGTCDSCKELIPLNILADVVGKNICKFCLKEFFGYSEGESEKEEKIDPKRSKTLDKF